MRQRCRRLRILHLTNCFRPDGGTEVSLANTLNTLDGSAFDIWVASLSGDGPLRDRLHLPKDRIATFDFGSNLTPTIAKIRRVATFLRQHAIEVVQTHLHESNNIGRLAAHLAQTPIRIATDHSVRYRAMSRFDVALDRFLSRATTQRVAVSEAVARATCQRLRLERERVTVIPNSVPSKTFRIMSEVERRLKRRELGIQHTDLVIATVGRLDPEKNHDLLLVAMRRLTEKFPGVRLLLAGYGPLRPRLEAQARSLGIGSYVHFLGFRKDIEDILEAADIFVLPSEWEGLPLALLEAGAKRLPAVASNVGGVPEIIKNGETGFLVEPGDVMKLVNRLTQLLGNPVLRKTLGEACQRRIWNRYRSEYVVPQLEHLYWRLWEGRVNEQPI
jgi:glycosyltransferase involved in cell wall biosynthesis